MWKDQHEQNINEINLSSNEKPRTDGKGWYLLMKNVFDVWL